MARTNSWAKLAIAAALTLPLAGCKDTKTLEENEQLKTKVAELQKENGQLGNDVETATTARDQLAKENDKLKAEIKTLKGKTPAKKTAHKKHHRSSTTS